MKSTLEPRLTPEERLQRRRLLAADTASLLALLVFTVALFAGTALLFRGFTYRRADLADRWRQRGDAALQAGHPDKAVDALRTALEYSPGQRAVEVELATALAASGRTAEATAYFNALWETEPGSGEINLALARLAVRQGNEPAAREDYHAAIYGTWEGDGTVRRREVRLELVQYLLSRGDFEPARNELLIAAGNAPSDQLVRLRIASLFEAAHDDRNALHQYREVLAQGTGHRSANLAALEGAGRTAFALGLYQQARDYLERAQNHPEMEREPPAIRAAAGSELRDAVHILLLYPSPALPARVRAERILHARSIAAARLATCLPQASSALASSTQTSSTQTSSTQTSAPISASPDATVPGRTVQGSSTSESSNVLPTSAPAFEALLARWAQEPAELSVRQLERSGQVQQAELRLAYDTVLSMSASVASGMPLACGPATGNAALLLRIAERPDAVEQQP
ncbi:MAG TPA: tetratricopeptide repeat protein [Acidisarcina sp.]